MRQSTSTLWPWSARLPSKAPWSCSEDLPVPENPFPPAFSRTNLESSGLIALNVGNQAVEQSVGSIYGGNIKKTQSFYSGAARAAVERRGPSRPPSRRTHVGQRLPESGTRGRASLFLAWLLERPCSPRHHVERLTPACFPPRRGPRRAHPGRLRGEGEGGGSFPGRVQGRWEPPRERSPLGALQGPARRRKMEVLARSRDRTLLRGKGMRAPLPY